MHSPKECLEGLPYVAILLLLLLLVLFLILLFIFLFLLCASRLSTRQSKVDGTVVDRDGDLAVRLLAELAAILRCWTPTECLPCLGNPVSSMTKIPRGLAKFSAITVR